MPQQTEEQLSAELPPVQAYRQGIKDCVPTLIGYMSIGIAAGVIGVTSHFSVLEVFLLSLIVYAGSAQFIICALFLAESNIATIVITTFIVNVRHVLLSLTIAPFFAKHSLLKRIFIGGLLTDESFGVAVYKAHTDKKLNFYWMSSLNVTAYLCWVFACTVGAVLANWIDDPKKLGLDFALTAMFSALLMLTLKTVPRQLKKIHYGLIVYGAIAMPVLSLFMDASLAVLVATVSGALLGGALENAA